MMAFLTPRLVPSISGCISQGSADKTFAFSSLTALMKMAWRANAFLVTVDGSYSSDDGSGYIRTYEDSGSAQTPIGSPSLMSEFLCSQGRIFSTSATIEYSYTSTNPEDPSGTGTFGCDILIETFYALKNGTSYFLPGSRAGTDVVSTDGTGMLAGSCYIDGEFVAPLYYNATSGFTPVRAYTITFTTIQENIPE